VRQGFEPFESSFHDQNRFDHFSLFYVLESLIYLIERVKLTLPPMPMPQALPPLFSASRKDEIRLSACNAQNYAACSIFS
jgi:hypothetical protein